MRSPVSRVAAAVIFVLAIGGVAFWFQGGGATPALEDRLTPEPASVDGSGAGVAAELLLLKPGELDYLEEMP